MSCELYHYGGVRRLFTGEALYLPAPGKLIQALGVSALTDRKRDLQQGTSAFQKCCT